MAIAPASPRPFTYSPPPPGPLPIVHADEHILVLDKPAGLLTVAGNTPALADCLEARVLEQYPTATMIHRLDMDTSGLIVLALNARAHAHIGKQFEKRLTTKTYIALVQGQLTPESGRIDQPMKSDWPNRPKQHVDPVDGRAAITDWQVLETAPDHTRLRLTPLTGRTHQLRVHMAFLGHPILGDNLYAPAEALAASPRLCLHAETLVFRHPDGGAPMVFNSPAPF
ncbi:RluA family pseudouridine synthase [Maricaulis sp.]|uniref:RluA family pseudouridine synthase n=1 Tax=Maricaulis sp. TaxID=1486257 RepID=UPI003A8DDCBB